jgi:SAM-dependent methyltransferase
MQPLDVNDNSEVYYGSDYWNNLDCTNRMINRRISGNEAVNWWQHFANRSGQVFRRALILNCGNGWVEREMLDAGFIKEAVGIDYSASLLDKARKAAGDRPLVYVQMNINTEELPADHEPFDLVVNHAAAHHITRLDRVFRNICTLLPDDGWFISFDYVGPHRNQYTLDSWDQAWRLNRTLPDHLRQSMVYPSLEVSVEMDPTEAVHSELIVDTLHRYFHVEEFVPLGGALAYPVLTHNAQLFSAEVEPGEREHWGQVVLDRDGEYLAENPLSSLFAYFTAQPNKEVLSDEATLELWKSVEEAREAEAAENGGNYCDCSVLNDLYAERAALQASVLAVQQELETIRTSFLYSRLTRILAIPLVRRVLQSSFARSLKESRHSPG